MVGGVHKNKDLSALYVVTDKQTTCTLVSVLKYNIIMYPVIPATCFGPIGPKHVAGIII